MGSPNLLRALPARKNLCGVLLVGRVGVRNVGVPLGRFCCPDILSAAALQLQTNGANWVPKVQDAVLFSRNHEMHRDV